MRDLGVGFVKPRVEIQFERFVAPVDRVGLGVQPQRVDVAVGRVGAELDLNAATQRDVGRRSARGCAGCPRL